MSLQRLETFLNNNELDPDCVDRNGVDPKIAISVRDGSFQWDPEEKAVLSE